VVCCDKTGTLTKNEMTVVEIITSDDQHLTLDQASGDYILDGQVASPIGWFILQRGIPIFLYCFVLFCFSLYLLYRYNGASIYYMCW